MIVFFWKFEKILTITKHDLLIIGILYSKKIQFKILKFDETIEVWTTSILRKRYSKSLKEKYYEIKTCLVKTIKWNLFYYLWINS